MDGCEHILEVVLAAVRALLASQTPLGLQWGWELAPTSARYDHVGRYTHATMK